MCEKYEELIQNEFSYALQIIRRIKVSIIENFYFNIKRLVIKLARLFL